MADEEGYFDFSYKSNPDVFFTARAVGGSKDAVSAVLFGTPNSHVVSIPRQESNFAAVRFAVWLAMTVLDFSPLSAAACQACVCAYCIHMSMHLHVHHILHYI